MKNREGDLREALENSVYSHCVFVVFVAAADLVFVVTGVVHVLSLSPFFTSS